MNDPHGICKITANGGGGAYTVTQVWWDADASEYDDATAPAGLVGATARDVANRADGQVDDIVSFRFQLGRSGNREVIIDVGGTALPEGSKGDILYHDGDKWTTLSGPASDGTFWLKCVRAGSGSTYTFSWAAGDTFACPE